MGVILGILQGADGAPCVESPDSPSIDIGEPECLLSTDTDNPPSSENFQNIRSVRVVEVKRTFTCFKKDFQTVRNWLASLDGGHLQYNAGLHGKAVIAGKFRLVGGISMTPLSATLGTVEATWRGYVLDANIDLADSIRFRQDTPTQWSILCGETVVLTATSKTEGDGTGLLLVPGETVTWANLPADVKANAPQYTVVEAFPDTPEACESALTGREYNDVSIFDPDTNWIIGPYNYRVFSAGPYAYYTKWRAIRLKCNGENVLTWWVQVSHTANSIDSSKGIRVFPVYYARTADEITTGDGAIHGPLDITDNTNWRLTTAIQDTAAVVEYTGDAGPDAWAFRPNIEKIQAEIQLRQAEIDALKDAFPYSEYPLISRIEDYKQVSAGTYTVMDGRTDPFDPRKGYNPVHRTTYGNYWAFPAFPGDKEKTIRFSTAANVWVTGVSVSPSGQVEVKTVTVEQSTIQFMPDPHLYFFGRLEKEGQTVKLTYCNGAAPGLDGITWGDLWKMYGQTLAQIIWDDLMARGYIYDGITPVQRGLSSRAVGEESNSDSGSTSTSGSGSSSSSSSSGETIHLYPRVFMAFMEGRINERLVERGFIQSVDDENAFHYDIDWTSKDPITIKEGLDLPAGCVNPVYIDADALASNSGFIPSKTIDTALPPQFRTVSLAKRTTNTSEDATFDEKGAFSHPGIWQKTVDGSVIQTTYEAHFRAVMRELVPGISDEDASPSAFGFYAAQTGFHYAEEPDRTPYPISQYALVGYVFAAEGDELVGDSSESDPDSVIKLFWREDDASVALLANNGLGRNPLLTFQKTEASNSAS